MIYFSPTCYVALRRVGVTPVEDFIRFWEATNHTMMLNMPPRHPIKLARCSPYETQNGQPTDEAVHTGNMPGESRTLPLLRLSTAAMQSDAMSRVSDPQRTVWGGRQH